MTSNDRFSIFPACSTWRNIAISRTNEDDVLAEKMEKATKYANFRLQKYIFHHWHSHAKVRKEQLNGKSLQSSN